MKQPVFSESWSDEVKRVYEHDMKGMWDSSISRHVFNTYQRRLEMYKSLVQGESKKILDIGCAQATLSLLLAEDGHHVTAVDLREEFLKYAETRFTHGDIKFLQGNIFELELNEKYDVIYANQIIEHLVYPEELVKRLSSLLASNGVLVMTTPNGEYIRNSLPSYTELGDPKDWEHMQFTSDGDGHFFAYTQKELDDIFRKAGMKYINCQSFETPWISGHMRFSYLHRLLPYSFLKRFDKFAHMLPFSKVFSYQLLVIGRLD